MQKYFTFDTDAGTVADTDMNMEKQSRKWT